MQQRHLSAAAVLLGLFLPLACCLNPSVNVGGAGSSRAAAAAAIAGGGGVGGGGGRGWAKSFPLSSLRGGGWWNPGQPGGLTIGGGLTKLRASLDSMSAKMKDGGGKGKLLEGKWRKESEKGQDLAMQQLGLNMVFRKAAGLLSKLEIRASPELEIITKGAVVVSIKASLAWRLLLHCHIRLLASRGIHSLTMSNCAGKVQL
jgi:hypothetical protein